MAKKTDASLKGKKPANTAGITKKRAVMNNPSNIRNKIKRSEMYGKYLQEKSKQKPELRNTDEISWPVMYQYSMSMAAQMGASAKRMLHIGTDGVRLSNEETLKTMALTGGVSSVRVVAATVPPPTSSP